MKKNEISRIIFVSGLSGAGKSVVLHTLEDLNFYCIDNLPIGLLEKLYDQLLHYPKHIAIGINARNQESLIPTLTQCINKFRKAKTHTELIYLEADSDILTKRFSETRRKHPFSDESIPLRAAISNERHLLSHLATGADLIIDTSQTTVHDLRRLISERVFGRDHYTLSLQLMSFGFKNGSPRDADFIFDVRCLPNPYWEDSLRNHTGKDEEVVLYLEQQSLVLKMVEDLVSFLTEWLKHFEAENRSYLTVAIGCTGGRHRSVYIVDKLAEKLPATEKQIIVRHRDL